MKQPDRSSDAAGGMNSARPGGAKGGSWLRARFDPAAWLPWALVLGLLLVGLAWAADYGESQDEMGVAAYAEDTIRSYTTLRPPQDLDERMNFYGPAYALWVQFVAWAGLLLTRAWSTPDARHFAYYLTLPFSTYLVFWIARRYVGWGASLLAAALFASQPVIFGHSFINPKDIPFMAGFLASMSTGLYMVDRIQEAKNGAPAAGRLAWRGNFPRMKAEWTARPKWQRGLVLLFPLVAVCFLVEANLLHEPILRGLRQLVQDAYSGTSVGWVNQLFSRLAAQADQVGVQPYLDKLERLYRQARLALTGVGLVISLGTLRWMLRSSLAALRGYRMWESVGLAGLALGLTTSIRFTAPLAGLLIGVLLLVRVRRAALLPLAAYLAVAALVCYLSWPFLWAGPLQGLARAFQLMAGFPWNHEVLFSGRLILAQDLPWFYLPVYFLIQLTEPALLLLGVGCAALLLKGNRTPRRDEFALLAAWFLLPILLVIGAHARVYDNMRQFLFVLPPLFVLAALGAQALLRWLRRPALRLLLAALVLLPGVGAIAALHPYEYIYYNSLVGGVEGAFRRYELDYWYTAYREALNYVNEQAPEGADIYVDGPWHVVLPFLRNDLRVYPRPGEAFDASLALVSTRANQDLTYREDAPVVFEVWRGGALLAVVKDLAP
jgi:hypothetical protein